MAEETKNQSPAADTKAMKERVGELEKSLKVAFKEGRFADVRKTAEELRAVDSENHLAVRMVEKVTEAEQEKKKKENAEQIKTLEKELKSAYKKHEQAEVNRLMEELKKLDEKNSFAIKIQKKMDSEKEALEKAAKKEKLNGLSKEAKMLLKNEEWVKAKEKADELLKLEPKNSFALKVLKKIEKNTAKKAEVKTPAVEPVIDAKKEPKKPGFFARLFSKKTKEKAPIKPIAPNPTPMERPEEPTPVKLAEVPAVKPEVVPAVQPANIAPQKPIGMPIAKLSEIPKKAEIKPVKDASKKAGQGNIFTSLFGKKEEPKEMKAESIIDTIVAKSEKTKEVEKQEKEKAESTGEGLAKFSGVFLKFALAFIAVSAAFFYAQIIDIDNRVFSLMDQENYAIQLHNAGQELNEKQGEQERLSKEIDRYEEGYRDASKDIIIKIAENRMDWPDLLRKLNEVTESVYEKNALLQYVQYNNYNYDVDTGRLSLSATLSDPKGRNLTKLAELEEAFQSFPKDKNDDTDDRNPYFYGLQEFTSYAKTFNSQSGRFLSNFSLTLYTKEIEQNQ